MPLLFCNISWMREYKGHHRIDGQEDQPRRGGKFVVKFGVAHECCNFLPEENGIVYGHVETWRGDIKKGQDTQIKIENLGANRGALHVDGVDVVWTATHESGGKRVVGWYRNARIYRFRQKHEEGYPTEQHGRDKVSSYRIIARQEDVHLIAEHQRNLLLDRNRNRTGWPGESSTFYPSLHEDNLDLTDFLEQLNNELIGHENENENRAIADPSGEYMEGRMRLRRHITKERSAELVSDFKSRLTDYSCSICGFSFERYYGRLGRGFVEAHHTIPIAKLTAHSQMSVADLIAVCSNCHRMLHRATPPLSANELRRNIAQARKTA
jgi:5-methylcytosine-specific restriction enzyme A